MHLRRCSWHDSFWSVFIQLRGGDDGDIGFRGDVVAHVALGDVSVRVY